MISESEIGNIFVFAFDLVSMKIYYEKIPVWKMYLALKPFPSVLLLLNSIARRGPSDTTADGT